MENIKLFKENFITNFNFLDTYIYIMDENLQSVERMHSCLSSILNLS